MKLCNPQGKHTQLLFEITNQKLLSYKYGAYESVISPMSYDKVSALFVKTGSNTLIESGWVNRDMVAENKCDELRAKYREAAPFPHLVIDQLFSETRLRAVASGFENASSGDTSSDNASSGNASSGNHPSEHGSPVDWRNFHGVLQNKRATASNSALPNTVQDYFNFLYSGPFIKFLSQITGINDLIPDPSLYGGGMHQVNAGGRFEIHMDFKRHPATGLANRLAVITYLNDNWMSEDGGALELWRLNPSRRVVSVDPTFARTVIMAQSERSAHGHPKPVAEGRQRRSVIAYFYTARPAGEGESDTLTTTTYIPHAGYSRRQELELYLRKITPVFIHKRLRAILEALRATKARLRDC